MCIGSLVVSLCTAQPEVCLIESVIVYLLSFQGAPLRAASSPSFRSDKCLTARNLQNETVQQVTAYDHHFPPSLRLSNQPQSPCLLHGVNNISCIIEHLRYHTSLSADRTDSLRIMIPLPLILQRLLSVLLLIKPVHWKVEQDAPLDKLWNRLIQAWWDRNDDRRGRQVTLVVLPMRVLGRERLRRTVEARKELFLGGWFLSCW